jgi:phosphoribulokinase
VDTSNPFVARDVPALDESIVIISFKQHHTQDFPYLMKMIDGSFMSRRNTIVVPGGKMGFAMELIVRPLLQQLIEYGKIG